MTAVILGKCDTEDEATLQLLKAAKLIEGCWDKYGTERVLSWRMIVAAIRALDDRSHRNIICSNLPVYKRRAITKKEFDAMNCERHCEHPSLSLCEWGMVYRAIHIPHDTEVLNAGDRKAVLAALCLFYKWDDMELPGKKAQSYKLLRHLKSKEHIETVNKWAQGGCLEFMESYVVPPAPPFPPCNRVTVPPAPAVAPWNRATVSASPTQVVASSWSRSGVGGDGMNLMAASWSPSLEFGMGELFNLTKQIEDVREELKQCKNDDNEKLEQVMQELQQCKHELKQVKQELQQHKHDNNETCGCASKNWYCPSSECHRQKGKCKKWTWAEAGHNCRVLIMPECFVPSNQASKMTAVILGECDKEAEATLQPTHMFVSHGLNMIIHVCEW